MPKARKTATPARRTKTTPVVHTPGAIDAYPDPQAIATRAYELFLRRGAAHGHDWEDWLHAEKELTGGDQQQAG
jgi:Protein of unknown function (DUF2934)